MSSTLVTGANGYIGGYLGRVLEEKGIDAVGVVRSSSNSECQGYRKLHRIKNITSVMDWASLLNSIDCVIHLAAIAHVTSSVNKAQAEFDQINCTATVALAEQAAIAGVRRFIYLSSVGVLGDHTSQNAFTNESKYSPKEPYAISKMNAEIQLKAISKKYPIEIVIIRPPLVYGPGAPGNFNRLLKLVRKGYLLPLGCFHKKKHMVSLYNLTDFMIHCISSPAAANRHFLVADGDGWSAVELIKLISKCMKIKCFLVPVPLFVVLFFAGLFKKASAVKKLSSSLEIDCEGTYRDLQWHPPQDPEIGLKEAVDFFLQSR